MLSECPIDVPYELMASIVQVESGFNPYAIGVVGDSLVRQPKNINEALATVKSLEKEGKNFSLGLAQVNRYNLKKYGFESYAEVFKAGALILKECYSRSAPDWGKALSCYYSGNFTVGYKHGYVQKVSSVLQEYYETQKIYEAIKANQNLPSIQSLPSIAIQKSVPSLTSLPSIPSVPNLPNQPSMQSIPSQPIVQSQQSTPSQPSIQSQPNIPIQSSQPTINQDVRLANYKKPDLVIAKRSDAAIVVPSKQTAVTVLPNKTEANQSVAIQLKNTAPFKIESFDAQKPKENVGSDPENSAACGKFTACKPGTKNNSLIVDREMKGDASFVF
jgi:type IV secretion system protein VirB1